LTPTYSTLFSCLYDQPDPIGHLGRGTHYSVLRSVEWLDVVRTPQALPQIHDFAVIWDEDHDVRVIRVIERIYMAGLLSPIQFIGERKGSLHVIVAAKFFYWGKESTQKNYIEELKRVVTTAISDDAWTVEMGMFDRAPNSFQNEFEGLIAADEDHVLTYLKNIDMLWNLGTKPADSYFLEILTTSPAAAKTREVTQKPAR
jgi:hypothetical protein